MASPSPPHLPPISDNSDLMDEVLVAGGLKREAESPLPRSYAKKPRDNRLRDCFIITPIEAGGESIACKYCAHYNKTLQKFNPTKARAHLTSQCSGVDDTLRQLLMDTTQAAKKLLNQAEGGDTAVVEKEKAMTAAAAARFRKTRKCNRASPSYLSIHTDDTSLDVTAPIDNGELILRLSFPTDNLKLNFNGHKQSFGAAMCIDGFMNLKSDASWTASMCSMTSEGTRAGPHCQWSLDPDANGKYEGVATRVEKIEQLLKTLVMV